MSKFLGYKGAKGDLEAIITFSREHTGRIGIIEDEFINHYIQRLANLTEDGVIWKDGHRTDSRASFSLYTSVVVQSLMDEIRRRLKSRKEDRIDSKGPMGRQLTQLQALCEKFKHNYDEQMYLRLGREEGKAVLAEHDTLAKGIYHHEIEQIFEKAIEYFDSNPALKGDSKRVRDIARQAMAISDMSQQQLKKWMGGHANGRTFGGIEPTSEGAGEYIARDYIKKELLNSTADNPALTPKNIASRYKSKQQGRGMIEQLITGAVLLAKTLSEKYNRIHYLDRRSQSRSFPEKT